MKEDVLTVGFLWKCFHTIFFKIGIYSERGEPAFQKIINTFGEPGINPLTGCAIRLNRESNQVVSFYCEQDEAWWVSVNAGDNWSIVPTNKSFLKIIHLVDIVL